MNRGLGHIAKLSGGCLMWVGMLAISLLITSLFIRGAAWMSVHAVPWLLALSIIVFLLDLLVFLPLGLFQTTRGFCAKCIYLSSFIFGVTDWLIGFFLCLKLWGIWAVIIGLIMMGVGIVPVAILATLFKGEWGFLLFIIVMTFLTFGMRFLGILLAHKSERKNEEKWHRELDIKLESELDTIRGDILE